MVFNHLEMQWKWNAWLHIPHATVHSSEVAEAWLAWHSMHRSMMWFRQMAQLSTTMSHAHSATAFHFFTSNLFLSPLALLEEEGTSGSWSTSILSSFQPWLCYGLLVRGAASVLEKSPETTFWCFDFF